MKKFWWYILILIFVIPACFNLIRPGYFYMQDDLQAFRIQQMDKCFDDFQIPCRWIPDGGYGYGYPQFNYYPPSVYYLGVLFHRLGFQYIDAVKILFVLGYIASAVAMFVLVDALIGPFAGFVSSIVYTYVPYKAVEVYVRGAMSEFWSFVLFPLIFWSSYKLIKTEKKKYFIWFSVSVYLLLLTHNLMTLIFAPVACTWVLYWLIVEKKLKFFWHKFVLSGLLGLGIASFFTLPVLFENKFVHVDSVLSGYFDYRQHFVNIYKLFLSREWGYGSSGFPNEKLNLSVGIVQWITGILAVVLAFINYKKNKKISIAVFLLAVLSLGTLFMIHQKSSFIWARLPVLWWLQFPWRFLSVSVFLLSVLSGYLFFFLKKIQYPLGVVLITLSFLLNISFFTPKEWLNITDNDKFSGESWQKQMTISIFDYLPIYSILPPINEAPKEPEILDGLATIISYEKGSNFQKGIINVDKDATVRLPLFDFPGMKVFVDDKLIEHANNDCRNQEFCYGLISFGLPSGEHKIEAELTNTPVRTIGNLISLFSFGAVIWLTLKKKS